MYIFIIIILVGFSGIFSGLTLAYFSLNKDELKRKSELGDKKAQAIYKVRQKSNLLLCTLLIGNVLVNTTLSVYLGTITTSIFAVVVATILIVIFGEILPQATFSRYAIFVGYKFAWLVKFFIFIFYPVCWPLSWLLDWLLGDERLTIYSKKEIIKMVEDHEDSSRSLIDEDEEKIIKGALSYSDKKVKVAMTNASKVFFISADAALDRAMIQKIQTYGHSRIPVYKKNKNNIVGILYVKDLIHVSENKLIVDVMRRHVHYVTENKKLDEVLNAFRHTRHHLFVVKNTKEDVLGIITIEDVIEEIIGEEIIDEYDRKEVV
ncbi:DUF21 domain-containing protein [Patescibacteria group bacterium]|nr:DUF21 domain-containing protein [Patescibacteria group bacterium]